MKILQKVIVKQILTEKSKEALLKKYEEELHQLQKECDQLRFELKRMEKTKKYPLQNLQRHFEREMGHRKEKMKLIEFQMEQLHMLPLGSELKEKEVEGIVEVKVGDSWDQIVTKKTIIVKDGIVTEIREG